MVIKKHHPLLDWMVRGDSVWDCVSAFAARDKRMVKKLSRHGICHGESSQQRAEYLLTYIRGASIGEHLGGGKS